VFLKEESGWMRLVGHVARMGKNINEYRVLEGKLKVRDHFENLCVGG
jgi:hypothetical protein